MLGLGAAPVAAQLLWLRMVPDSDLSKAANEGIHTSNAMIQGKLAGSNVRISVYPRPARPRNRLGWKQ